MIHSEAGEPLRLQTDLQGPLETSGSREYTIKPLEEGSIEIDLKRGEFVVLYPQGRKPDLKIAPVPAQEASVNFFGSVKS